MFYDSKKYLFKIISTIIFFVTTFFSCNKKTNAAIGRETSVTIPKKILALGDSYTIGQSVNEEDRFINKTIFILKSSVTNLQYPAQIIAQTGWTTKNLLDGLLPNTGNITPPYDIVTLLIGVNNQYLHLDTTIYRNEFTMCFQNAITLSGNRKNRVFVLSASDYGATPFNSGNAAQIGMEIDRFTANNKQVSLQMGINYTDITPSSRMAATDITLVASDGLHPSGKEYLKWANMLAPKMLPLLQ